MRTRPHDGGPRRQVPTGPDGRRAGAAHPLLALQETAGNRAVTALVQREPKDAGATEPGAVPPRDTLAAATARHGALKAEAAQASRDVWSKSFGHKEWGGIIYRQGARYGHTTRTAGEEGSIDIGQREENAGCPAGATPFGYWHTHPGATELLSGQPRIKREGAEAFSDNDKDVAKDYQLDPFVRDMYGLHDVAVESWFDGSTYPPWSPPKLPAPSGETTE